MCDVRTYVRVAHYPGILKCQPTSRQIGKTINWQPVMEFQYPFHQNPESLQKFRILVNSVCQFRMPAKTLNPGFIPRECRI